MSEISDLHSLVLILKKARREGWVERNLDADSIADHSYGAIVIGWYIATEENVDVDKVIKILLVHDLVMAKMEDVTPLTGKYDKKREIEEGAKKSIAELIPGELKRKYLDLFGEFNEDKSPEAIVAREADKLETLLQGEDYEIRTGRTDVISEQLEYYLKYFKTQTGKRIHQEIKKRHEERKNE